MIVVLLAEHLLIIQGFCPPLEERIYGRHGGLRFDPFFIITQIV